MIAKVPSWEDPINRFLEGESELESSEGATFCLWDALLLPQDAFPLEIGHTRVSYDRVYEAGYWLLASDEQSESFADVRDEARKKLFPELNTNA